MPTSSSTACSGSTSAGSLQPSGTSAPAGAAGGDRRSANDRERTTGVDGRRLASTSWSRAPRYPHPDRARVTCLAAGLARTSAPVARALARCGRHGAHVRLRRPSCADGEASVPDVFDWTDNQGLANAADSLIGKPAAMAWLLILFFVIRWLLHRLVDRLVAARRGRHAARPDQPLRLPAAEVGARSPPGPGDLDPAGAAGARPWATCSRASSPASLLAIIGDHDAQRARRQHRPDHRQRRHPRPRPRLRRPDAWSRTSSPASS